MAHGIKRYEEETEQQKAAFSLWVKMGEGRSHAKVARILGVTDRVVDNWAKFYTWGERLAEMKQSGELERLAKVFPALAPHDTTDVATQGRLEKLGDRLEVIVNTGLDRLERALQDENKMLEVGDLVKIVKEFRESLVAHRRGTQPSSPTTKIDKLTLILNNMSQEDRIALINAPTATRSDVPRGDLPASSGGAEADYEELPDPGVEEAAGCGGDAGGAGGSEGGVEGELPAGGPRVSLVCFE